MDINEFRRLIIVMTSDSEERENAEGTYNDMILENLENVITNHINNIISDNNTAKTSAVLLPNIAYIARQQILAIENAEFSDWLLEKFIEILSNPKYAANYRNISEAMARFANVYLPCGHWENFLEQILSIFNVEKASCASSVMYCLVRCLNTKTIKVRPHLEALTELINQAVQSGNIALIRSGLQLLYAISSIKSIGRMLNEAFAPIVLQIITNISAADIQPIIADLATFTDQSPIFFAPVLNDFLISLIEIGQNSEYNDNTRFLALDSTSHFFSVFAEELEESVGDIFQALVGVIAEITEDFDPITESAEQTIYDAAETAITRLSYANSNSLDFIPNVSESIEEMAKSGELGPSYAAFIALASISEVVQDNYPDFYDEYVPEILSYGFANESPIVRYSVFKTIVAITRATDRDLKSLLSPVVGAICEEPDDALYPIEINALTELLDKERELSKEDGETIMQLVGALLGSSAGELQLAAIRCIVAIAQCLQEDFKRYFEEVSAFLMAVIEDAAQSYEQSMFFECLTGAGNLGQIRALREEFEPLAALLVQTVTELPRDELGCKERNAINTTIGNLVKIADSSAAAQESLGVLAEYAIAAVEGELIPEEREYELDRSSLASSERAISNKESNKTYVYTMSQIEEASEALVTLRTVLMNVDELNAEFVSRIKAALKYWICQEVEVSLSIQAASCSVLTIKYINWEDENSIAAFSEQYHGLVSTLSSTEDSDELERILSFVATMAEVFSRHSPEPDLPLINDLKELYDSCQEIIEKDRQKADSTNTAMFDCMSLQKSIMEILNSVAKYGAEASAKVAETFQLTFDDFRKSSMAYFTILSINDGFEDVEAFVESLFETFEKPSLSDKTAAIFCLLRLFAAGKVTLEESHINGFFELIEAQRPGITVQMLVAALRAFIAYPELDIILRFIVEKLEWIKPHNSIHVVTLIELLNEILSHIENESVTEKIRAFFTKTEKLYITQLVGL